MDNYLHEIKASDGYYQYSCSNQGQVKGKVMTWNFIDYFRNYFRKLKYGLEFSIIITLMHESWQS